MVWREPRTIHAYGLSAEQIQEENTYMNEQMEKFRQSILNPVLPQTNPVIPTQIIPNAIEDIPDTVEYILGDQVNALFLNRPYYNKLIKKAYLL